MSTITLSRNLKNLFARTRRDLIDNAREYDELLEAQIKRLEIELVGRSRTQSCIRCENATWAFLASMLQDAINFRLHEQMMSCSKFHKLQADEYIGLLIPTVYLCGSENNGANDDLRGSDSELSLPPGDPAQFDLRSKQQERQVPERNYERGG